jgi:hypothetical protein
MSNYGNISSGYTDTINQIALRCKYLEFTGEAKCCLKTPPGPLTVQVPSMILLSKKCPPPSAADFALYPKVAQQSSVRTQALSSPTCNILPNPMSRFSRYTRYTPPVPCQALPQIANMAGISLPSTRECSDKPRGY